MIFRAFWAFLRKMDLCFYKENRCELKILLQVGEVENRVLFRGIWGNGYHGTKPCTFWQKSILRGKSENHGTKVEGEYILTQKKLDFQKSFLL